MMINQVSKRSNFTLVFSLIVLLFTLRSYYFYSISLAPTPVLGALMLVGALFFYRVGIRDSELKALAILMFIFTCSILPAFFSDSPYLNSILGLIINLFIFSSIMFLKRHIYDYLFGINYVLVIHCFFFFLQFFFYYFLGEKLDFLEPITGEVQRVAGYERIAEQGGIAIFRPSGLFSEPSSYCVFLITLLWVLKIANKQSKFAEASVLLTILSSFSISGIVFACAYVLLNYSRSIKLREFLLGIGILSVLFYISFDHISSYFEYRILNLGDDSSAEERLKMFTLFKELEWHVQLFGSGVGNDIFDIPLTTIPSLLVYLGIFGTFMFFVFLVYSYHIFSLSKKTVVFFILITFNFYKISNPYVWFILSLLFIVSYEYNRNRNNA